MPNYVGRYVRGSTEAYPTGSYMQQGLPNITGTLGSIDEHSIASSGAFYRDGTSGKLENAGGSPDPNVYFDASRSNSIYGRYSDVIPESVSSNFIIKY